MEISYENRRLQRLCQEKAVANLKLGTATAKKLQARLEELATAENVAGLTYGDPHEYSGDRRGLYSLDLAGGNRLLFRPRHEPIPRTEAGNINWQAVTEVTIIRIGEHPR